MTSLNAKSPEVTYLHKVTSITLTTLAMASCFSASVNATSFTPDATAKEVAEFKARQQKIATLKQQSQAKVQALRSSPRNAPVLPQMTNGDSENREIDCTVHAYGYYRNFETCYERSIDMSHEQADIVFYYHRDWLAAQTSLGQAYKYARSEVEKANAAFAKQTDVTFKLVGFEMPSFEGYQAAEVTYYGQETYDFLASVDGLSFPEVITYDMQGQNYLKTDENGEQTNIVVNGLDSLLTRATYMADNYHRYAGGDYADLAPDMVTYRRMSPDIVIWARLREPQNTPSESNLCGYAGTGNFALMAPANAIEQPDYCSNVTVHELGHVYEAHHELAQNPSDTYRRSHAAECDGDWTVMHGELKASRVVAFSSPDLVVNSGTCGSELDENNLKNVKLSAPYIANAHEPMLEFGDVWLASDVTANEDDSSLSLTVMRDGDLSKPTAVKVFIDEGYKYLDQDFIHVDFAADVSERTITLNIINNDETTDNPVLTAELVLPLQLAVKASDATKSITITNDDAPVVVTPPAAESDTQGGDSGGGALGVMGLFILALAGLRRKR